MFLGQLLTWSGKTILASVMIDNCLLKQEFATAYFYCKPDDTERNTCTSIFKGLLSQLLRQCVDLIPHCYERCLSSGESTLSSATLTKQFLELFCERLEKLFFVIDGLDECEPPERKLVLHSLMTIIEKCDGYQPGKLRVLVVSQDFPDIRKALLAATVISIEPKDNKHDIERYIGDWTSRIQIHYHLDDVQTEFIRLATFARARGMIRFSQSLSVY
jgi:hypothetical protein